MQNILSEWIGAYYPYDMINNQRSKAILCLLFDKVICYFPVSSMACGGGHGLSEDLYGEDLLVKENVIELREETLLSEVDVEFSPGHYWGTDEEFSLYHRLQITAMALHESINSNIVPLTDEYFSPIPANILGEIDTKRFSRLQASSLAIHSMNFVIPPMNKICDEDILEVREKLKNELIPFRASMLSLCPIIRNGIESNAGIVELNREAKYIAETKVYPALSELQRRLEFENSKFWKRILFKGGSILPSMVINWATKNTIAAAINTMSSLGELASDTFNSIESYDSIIKNGGMGFLLKLSNERIFD